MHRQVALHAVAAQVEVAVAQAHDLVDLGAVVEREGRRLGDVEHLDACSRPPRPRRWRACGLIVPSGPRPHGARDPHDVLASAGRARRRRRTGRCPCGRGGRRTRGARRARGGARPSRTPRLRCPTCAARSSPHQWVRMLTTAILVARARRPCRRRTVSCAASAHRRTVTVPSATSCCPDDQRDRRARPVGLLHLRLHRPLSKARSAAHPGGAQLVGERERVRAVRPRRRRTRRRSVAGAGNTPSASQASNVRSMPDAEPDARRGRTAHLLDQPVVPAAAADARSAPSRASRRRTRTWCACSSRGLARGAVRARSGRRARRRPGLHPFEVCTARRRTGGRSCWGAAAMTAASSVRLESRTRSGLTAERLARLVRSTRRGDRRGSARSTSRYVGPATRGRRAS